MAEVMKKAIEERMAELKRMQLKIDSATVEMTCSGRSDGSWR